jgi:virginiamycin B lyase
MRKVITFLAAAALAGVLAGGAQPARSTAAGCASGAVEANINGKIVCLQPGGECQAALVEQYLTQGFLCALGKLEKIPAPRNLRTPAATKLPAGASTLALPAHGQLNQDVGTLAAGQGSVWVAGGLFRIAMAGGKVTGPFAKGESQDVAAGDSGVWASDYDGDVVRRYDQSTGKLVATIQLPHGSSPEGIVITPGAVWVAEHHGGAVARIDPATNRVVASISVGIKGHSGPQGIAAGLGSIWVGVTNMSEVVRIDERTNAVVARIVVPTPTEPCGGIGVAKTAVWVSGCEDQNFVARIDPATNATAAILGLNGIVDGFATDGANAWFVISGCPCFYSKEDAHLVEVAPNDTVLRNFTLGHGFYSGSTIFAAGSLWLGDWGKPLVIRLPMSQ